MNQVILTIKENVPAADGVFKMTLAGDVSAVTTPGQFINISLAGKFLRRPISVCDRSDDALTILYKIVGQGTAQHTTRRAGELGNKVWHGAHVHHL